MPSLCYIPHRQMKLDIAGRFCGVKNPSNMSHGREIRSRAKELVAGAD